ncbi:MAG: hypothetical protein IPJ76_17130 [Flavobacteriales bacterium]|nr:MAG: hypothetical protein IPJ76_17130 [Flavobacteriales bacterium]
MANRMRLDEVENLLRHYRTERRVLGFQMKRARVALKELQKLKSSLEKVEAARAKKEGVIKRGPGRPPKYAADGTVKRGPGRPRKNPLPDGSQEVVRKRRRGPGRPRKKAGEPPALNQWDNVVLGAINSKGRLMTKGELMDHAAAWARKNEPGMKASDVEIYVTRALQKLSGKAKMLGMHHTGLQRGNHYGIMDWFFRSTGKLRPSALEKLDLSDHVKG